MSGRFAWVLLLLCLVGAGEGVAPVAQGAERVTDFALLDDRGVFHQLSRYQHRQGLVVMAYDPACAVMPEALMALAEVRDGIGKEPGADEGSGNSRAGGSAEKQGDGGRPRGVDFLLIDAGAQESGGARTDRTGGATRTDATDSTDSTNPLEQTSVARLDFPLLQDEGELVSVALGLTQAGETLVLNPRRLAVHYRGPAGADLATVLSEIMGGETGKTAEVGETTDTIEASEETALSLSSCPLHYPAWQALVDEPPDYARDVAPVIVKNCRGCHRQGGVGPFALDSYLMVLGWSPMIREVVLNRRMPPMQVDSQFGHSPDARYLSVRERQLLVAWIDAGAPRRSEAKSESEKDPLEATASESTPADSRWLLGPPDHIVTAPRHPIAATGVMDYLYADAELDFGEEGEEGEESDERWLRAVQYLPGDESVLHHLMTFVTPPEEDFWGSERQQRAEPRRFVAGYSPGSPEAIEFAAGTGVRIPPGHKLAMQFHYVTNGQSTVDETRIGLYFYDLHDPHDLPGGLRELLTVPVTADFVLPPFAAEYPLQASHLFRDDVVITGVRPRMSFRGKRMSFAIQRADGSRQTFFSVPAYNYGWQPHYRLSEPLHVSAGTRVWVEGAFDNSESNPNNPAPEREVTFGVESWEEMFTGYIVYYVR